MRHCWHDAVRDRGPPPRSAAEWDEGARPLASVDEGLRALGIPNLDRFFGMLSPADGPRCDPHSGRQAQSSMAVTATPSHRDQPSTNTTAPFTVMKRKKPHTVCSIHLARER